MDIKIYKPSIHAIRSECEKHGQQLTLYCPSHLMPCCDECISKSHSNCTGIESLAGVVGKTKIDTKKESFDKDINSVIYILDEVVSNKTENIKRGEQQYEKVHQIEQQVHQYQRYVEDHEDDERAKIMEIKLEQNDEIDKTISKLEPLKSFGEVYVDKTKMAVNRERSVRSEAQVKSREYCKKNNMTMNFEKTIEIPIDREISDMICLMDGRLIIVELYCQVLTPDSKLQKQLPIPGEACSVTQINKNTIAISYPFEKVIKIFNMENETVIKVITLDKGCWGLSFANNSSAVACVSLNNNEIRIIDLEADLG
ncbi:unnamed protein product [Mytilus edulis]|uniref:B box-type domain-containing protein n=1 Tax=Mytilus edulis TaxID=6550 RepID=A0A8S3UQ21_MYTED|nr:unnamed protein product [Mytilus edulis]